MKTQGAAASSEIDKRLPDLVASGLLRYPRGDTDKNTDAQGQRPMNSAANPTAMLRTFCDAVEARDGKTFATLFTDDGVYHDAFYGAFAGRAKIAELINDWFYRTAEDFRWVMHDPVSDGKTLYARYTFSYRSKLPEANGNRAMFEGVSVMQLRDGLIATYHEVANTAPAFVDLNFAPERIAKIVGRQGAALKARDEMKPHLK